MFKNTVKVLVNCKLEQSFWRMIWQYLTNTYVQLSHNLCSKETLEKFLHRYIHLLVKEDFVQHYL